MADLKTLKVRIGSIKKTQKITKAMKMVAASKLRRAREAAENSRLYSDTLDHIVAAQACSSMSQSRSIVFGAPEPKTILIIVNTSDRGLCGGLNTNVVKAVVAHKNNYEAKGLNVKIWAIGKKGHDQFKHLCPENIILNEVGFSSRDITYKESAEIAEKIVELFNKEEIDICKIVYPYFNSAISQEAKQLALIPAELPESEDNSDKEVLEYEYEPEREALLNEIVPKNIAIQLYHAFLETFASEQGARMTAMDNAVNNCTDLVKRLNLEYNRTRQAKITTELVEIISAAESI